MSSLKCGIVGLPNVGKSTLFNALLKKRIAASANYPYTTIEPNIGVVAVPDPRLSQLARLVAREQNLDQTPPIIPATIEFVDIAGLIKGAHQGAGLGNQFLSHIREVDAIIHVLRDFEDENVARAGAENPDSDRKVVETELALADLGTVDKLITEQEQEIKEADPLARQKLNIVLQIKSELEQGRTLKQIDDEKLKDWFGHLPLLTTKPMLYILNVSEDKMIHVDQIVQEDTMIINAKLEEDLADFSEEERKEFLESVGFKQTGLERLIIKAYQILGLISFFTTTGNKEVRAWTIKKGTKAPQAAGVVHTDFEKGFIKAQVIEYDKLIEAGSYASARQKGWLRTEGKDYIVCDGDMIEFLVGN